MNKMKVLVVAGAFYPAKKYGGPVVSMDNMCSLLKDDMEFYLIARNHDLGEAKELDNIEEGWNCRLNCKVYYLKDNELKYDIFLNIFKKVSPDIVYINSLFDASFTLPFLRICKSQKCHVLLAPRGQLCSGAFKRKYKKMPYILYLKVAGLVENVYFQSTSEEETESIKKYLKVKEGRIFLLTNIPSIPKVKYEKPEKQMGQGKFVFLSRIHPKKNLLSAIKYFKTVKGKAIFDIYGPLEDEKYWKECQEEISKLPTNVQVNYCGLVSHDDVHEVFSKYDAFIFPTISENYGHVIAEALMVGTPVILGRGTTPWDDVDQVAGYVGELSNITYFSECIEKIIWMNDIEYSEFNKMVEEYIERKLSIPELKDAYEKSLNEILGL